MENLFHNEVCVQEEPMYSLHLDQMADKEFEDFLKRTDYVEQGPDTITCVPNWRKRDNNQ